MVFRRAFQRELTQTAAGVFVALFAILLTTQTIRLLNEAAGGKVAPEAVAALLGFSAMHSLPVVLSLTLFVATLLVVSRMHRDSEMVVWACSGVPLQGWVIPALRFSWPILALIAVVALFVSPWANEKATEYRQKINNRDNVAQIAPGTFRESGSADRVVFVESLGANEQFVANVFVSSFQHGRMGVMVASRGYRETAENGDSFLVMENGRRYELVPGLADFRILEFSRYAIRVDSRESQGVVRTLRNAPTAELLRSESPPDLGELSWRVGLPISTALLVVLAIPLGYVNPRAGRSANLIVAVLAFLAYNNAMGIMQSLIGQGRLPFAMSWWVIHAVMLLLAAVLLAHRAVAGRWRLPWPR